LTPSVTGTYTHPEIAHVGKYEHELQETEVEFEIFTRPLAPVDRSFSILLSPPHLLPPLDPSSSRCRCDGVENGFVKLIIARNSQKILGCTIVAPNAGDMISEITVCMQHDISVAQLAGVIHPYPTTQEAIRQCALQCYKHFKDPQGAPLKTLQLYMRHLEQQPER
jgi:pyruvate/2-oxoglutarate dehydrogenase complex dihydrolipoamide dehydrogenase (E3) component